MVGSANWDMRSFRLNFEINLEVVETSLARMLDDRMLGKRHKQLTLAEIANAPLPARLRDAGLRLLLPYL